MKRDGLRRLVLALLSSKDLRLRGVAPRYGGGLHARQEPPGCGRVGEHAAQIGVHHRGGMPSSRPSSSITLCSSLCCYFQLFSDSRPHWHTTGKELRRPRRSAAPDFPLGRGAFARSSPPPPPTNRVAVRHSPPKNSTLIGRPYRFSPRRHLWKGRLQLSESYRNVCVWARNGARAISHEP